jgi:hypothetical protein
MTRAERLRSLYERFDYVQKAGTNPHFKYRFVREADLKAKLNLALRELGLALTRTVVQYTGNGKDGWAHVRLHIEDEQGEVLVLEGVGGGQDSSDKAPAKAQVSAVKNAIMTGLVVQSGDDPEADGKADEDALEELLRQLATTGDPASLKARVATFRLGARWDELRAAYQAAVARCSGVASDVGGK